MKINNIMIPTKRGQIVKFHTSTEDKNLEQSYLILEYFDYENHSIAKIMASNTGLTSPPTSLVLAEDLEVDEVQTFQLEYYLKFGDHNLF
jgi:hypothetical protein